MKDGSEVGALPGEETLMPQISWMTLGESLNLSQCLHFKNWSWYCFLGWESINEDNQVRP